MLKSVAEPVSEVSSVVGLVEKLQAFLPDSRINWITAKHLGINSRVVVIERANQHETGFITLINPEIVEFHGPKLSRVESDFSLPELHVSVERRAEATIRFTDEFGNSVEKRFAGPNCRLILQAIDQLDGKLMTINLNKYRRQSIKGYLRHLSKKLELQGQNGQQKNLIES